MSSGFPPNDYTDPSLSAAPGKPTVPTGLPAAMDQGQILKAAQDQVNTELQSQIDPLQNQIGTIQTQRDRTIGDIGAMFSGLQPTVDQGVTAVSDSFAGAEKAQNDIFTSAQANINKLKQDRASQAQQLAQEMGGPVAVGEFTAGFDPAAEALANLGAGSRLHTLGYAQAGVQEASAFAGQVFPLLKTEQTAQARSYFEDQIKTTEKQISDLNAQRTALTNVRQNELTQQQLQYKLDLYKTKLDQINTQRTYTLQAKTAKLDQVKADHDWQATLMTLKNDERRIGLSERQFNLEEGKTTGTYKGVPTIQAKTLSVEEKRAAAALNLSYDQLKLRKEQLSKSSGLALKKLNADRQVTWNAYVDAAVNPSPGKSVPVSHTVEISYQQALKDPKNSWKDPKTGNYFHVVTTHEVITTDPITQPQDLYDYLIAHNLPKSVAANKVRARLGKPNWKPGQKKSAADWMSLPSGG